MLYEQLIDSVNDSLNTCRPSPGPHHMLKIVYILADVDDFPIQCVELVLDQFE